VIGLLRGDAIELAVETFRLTDGTESETCLYRLGFVLEPGSFLTGLGRLNRVPAWIRGESSNRTVGLTPFVEGFLANGRAGGVWSAGVKSSIAVYVTDDLTGENGILGRIGGARE
jgi:hypothetical protein